MQLILVQYFLDELVKDIINWEQKKLGKLQKLGTMKPRLKNTIEAIKSQNSSLETRFLQIHTTETQVRTNYRNFHTKIEHLLNISNMHKYLE